MTLDRGAGRRRGLGLRRHWPELAVLVAAVALVHLAVPILKEAIDRPRPEGGLVGASGESWPSGHAAYAVIYPWLALTVDGCASHGPA